MTRIIPRLQWREFCAGFSRLHAGWLASVDALPRGHPAPEPHYAGRELPLREVQADTAHPGPGRLVIVLEEHGRPVQHVIDDPESLALRQTPEGADEGLRIESPAGTITLYFREVIPPDMVDGV